MATKSDHQKEPILGALQMASDRIHLDNLAEHLGQDRDDVLKDVKALDKEGELHYDAETDFITREAPES
jgi:hypothetical protein